MKKSKVSQKQRRVRIVLAYLSLVLFTALQFIAPTVAPGLYNAVPLDFGLLGYIIVLGVLARVLRPLGYTKQNFFGPKLELDERQRQVLYRAYRITFYTTFSLHLTMLVTALITMMIFGNMIAGTADSGKIFIPVVVGLLMLAVIHYTLPSAMIAWLEPDPPFERGFEPQEV